MSYREIQILDAMNESGRAFDRGIASLYSVANTAQRYRVRELFRDEWDRYAKISDENPTTHPQEPYL